MQLIYKDIVQNHQGQKLFILLHILKMPEDNGVQLPPEDALSYTGFQSDEDSWCSCRKPNDRHLRSVESLFLSDVDVFFLS